MKFSAVAAAALAGVASAAYSKEDYISGVVHQDIMEVCLQSRGSGMNLILINQ